MSKSALMVFLGFLTPPLLVPMKPKWGPNCAADVPVRGARACARLVQEPHQHNWDPTFGRFELNPREQGLQNLKKTCQVTRPGWARGRRPGRPVPQALNKVAGPDRVRRLGDLEGDVERIPRHPQAARCKIAELSDSIQAAFYMTWLAGSKPASVRILTEDGPTC